MSRPLRFLYLTTFYPPYSFGGDAVYLHRVAHALGDAGHTVDVIHCVDSYHLLHPAAPSIAFAEHPNVTRHELRTGAGFLSPLLTHQTGRPVLTGRHLRRIAASHAYDVVHFHNLSLLGPGALAIEPANRDFVKLYTTHEHWLVCPMHVLWKFDSRACEAPECLRCTLKGGRPPQLWRYTGYLDRATRHVDRFLSPSRFTARMHAERGFRREIDVLPYFLDRQDEDWRNPPPRPQERPYFLFVGRLERIKGLHDAIEAWRNITDWDLLIAGEGAAGMDLRAQAAGNPRIKFLGARPQKELGALYANALATIVPSVTYETFGLVVIESLARKTPVIVRDLGALPELVRESGGGAIFRDNAELASAIQTIGASPALRGELGEKGYAAFARNWDRKAHLDRYFSFIGETRGKKLEGKSTWQAVSSRAAQAS
jgi:glycosyltransferase involved in cell wall biosynthesis